MKYFVYLQINNKITIFFAYVVLQRTEAKKTEIKVST